MNVLSLEGADWVSKEVAEVKLLALFLHLRVLLAQKPAHMSEEDS